MYYYYYDRPVINLSKEQDRRLANVDKAKIETIFVWIDVLGFKSMLKDPNNYEKLAKLLEEFQKKFEQKDGLFNTLAISDGLILELNPNRNIWTAGNVKNCLLYIQNKQFEFIRQNKVVVRGAIAVGTSWNPDNKKNKNYISNGLSNAYKLESEGICWPVIGTNGFYLKKMNELYSDEDDLEPFKNFFNKTLNSNGDDVFFLDIYSNLDDSDQMIIDDIIDKQLAENEKIRTVYSKYVWLYKCVHGCRMSKKPLNSKLEKLVL